MRLQFSPLPYVIAGLMLLLDATLAAPLGAQVKPMTGAAPDAKAITIDAPPAPPARSAQQGTSPLERIVSLDLRKVSLRSALDEISRQSGVALTYSPRVVPVERVVSVSGNKITVAKALATVLRGTGVEAEVTAGGGVMLVKGEGKAERRENAGVGAVFGRVLDAASKRPLGGAVVTIEGMDLAAVANDSGWYGIGKVPSGMRTVVARFLGYASTEHVVLVPDSQYVRQDFAMHMSMSRLQETVTTATGQQRRLELGNDITVINADSIVATQPVTSVTDLLEGRVPGMVIQRTSGAPGDPARIRLRGASSPRLSNDPIIIVDGVRVYSDQSGERGANLASTYGTYAAPSPLDYIDPNSIETIEVIKGPSAATLYGQDAANGVIVITSKKGQSGPARWTVSAERGMTEMPGNYPELMLRWGHTLTDGARVYCPISNRSGGATRGLICQADSTARFQMLNDPDLTVLDQGSRTAATIGVSGGSNALTYNVTGSYRDELGLVKLPTYEAERFRAVQGTDVPGWMDRPQKLTRWGAASRLLAQLGSKADVALSANLSRTEQQRSSLEQQLGRLMSVYLDRSSGTYYEMGGAATIGPTTETLTNYYERATAAATEFTNGANLNWRPLSWLTATADAGINIVQRSDEILLPNGYSPYTNIEGYLQTARGNSVTRTVNVRAQARVPLPHGFNLQLATGANYTGESVEDLTGSIGGIAKGTEIPLVTSRMVVGQRDLDNSTFGWYVEPQISHKRFWLSTGLRLDGGSTFGTRVKLPAFPKLSFSYLVSDEDFFPFKKLIPLLRLRVAYGQAGRQPGSVDKLRLYQAAAPVMIDGQLVDGVSLKSIGNTKLRPERSTEFEAGFDADLLGDRLTLGFTGFRKTTTDAMLSVPLPPSVYGFNVRTLKNVGVIRNSGFEASLGARVVRTDPVSLDVQVQLSQQRNEVVELGPGVEPFYVASTLHGGGTRVVAGYPLFGRWTKPLLGYADANGNGTLEESEVLVGDTAVFVGGTLPNYTANLNTTLSLLRGAIDVTAAFSYEDGMTQNNEVGWALAPFSAGRNDPQSSLAEQARMWDQTGFSWIQTVSTFRFKRLAVTYHAPASLAQRVGARALSLSVQGTNLGLVTNYWGIDPNVNAHATGNGVTDTGVLPQPRSWQVRVSANY